jgi:CubicO group peptidase (beta-lactamase class C family)
MLSIRTANKSLPLEIQFPVSHTNLIEKCALMSASRFVRHRLCVAGAIFSTVVPGLLTAQPSDEIEQRIEHIQNAILPPVLIKGEAVSTTKLADRMAALQVPGVSVAVIHDGKIEWARGFGVTQVGGPAVTPETLFQAASISKPVTALAVMHLAESGKLDLDADVNQYLKTWKVPPNTFTEKTKVTLRELLTHTAGITVHGFPGYASDAARPNVVQVLNGEKPANTPAIRVDTIPGTNWRYSGGGFVITQVLLEDVTGQPFPKLMNDLVLAPIGMTRSTYEQPLPPNRMAEAAMPYHPDGQAVTGGPHVYPEMAPAGLWTTPSDLARYAIEVQKALAGKSNAVLSPARAKEMLTPGKNRWGLGVETGGGAGHPYFKHGGANEGFQCDLVAYENGNGAVVMTNSDRGGQLASEVLRTIAHEYGWPDFQPVENTLGKVDPKILARYVGAYQLGPGMNMLVTLDGSQLSTRFGNQEAVPVFPESEVMFFAKVVDAKIEFAKPDANGVPSQLIVHQRGRDQSAKRLSEAEFKQIEAESKEIADATAAAIKRFKDQTQDPRTEAALRRNIGELQLGQPNYERMSSGLASVTRQQLPQLKATIAQLGSVESVTFKGVGPGGADIYEVKFEHGSTEWRILMQSDEKAASIGFRAQ